MISDEKNDPNFTTHHHHSNNAVRLIVIALLIAVISTSSHQTQGNFANWPMTQFLTARSKQKVNMSSQDKKQGFVMALSPAKRKFVFGDEGDIMDP